jgi:hypothetical protein
MAWCGVLGKNGKPIKIRRVVIRLDKPTRDGDAEIAILTNVPVRDADAAKIWRDCSTR